MLTGGAIGIAGMFHNWAFGIYALYPLLLDQKYTNCQTWGQLL